MPKVTVRFEVATREGRKHLATVEAGTVPRVGEKVQPEGKETYEVLDVMHTPVIREWEAVVLVRKI